MQGLKRFRGFLWIAVVAVLLCFLTGMSFIEKTATTEFEAEGPETEESSDTEETGSGLRNNDPILPESIPGGTSLVESEDVKLDYSFVDDAYFMALYQGGDEDALLRVEGPENSESFHYLKSGEGWQVFSLDKPGEYTIKIGKLNEEGLYCIVLDQSFTAEFVDPFLPYLRPDNECWYDSSSVAVDVAKEILDEKMVDTDAEAIDVVLNWFDEAGFEYDYLGREEGYKGNYTYLTPDETIKWRKGVCMDFATLACAMFRSQGIPAMIAVEKAEANNHAWVKVYNEGVWNEYDPTRIVVCGPENKAPDSEFLRTKGTV